MAYRFTGHARVNPTNPRAFGICDRCGFLNNLENLGYQHEWRGSRLMNIRLRVCPRCTDRPFIFNKPIIYPPDPVPVLDPRPQNFTVANSGSPFTPPLPWPVQPLGPPIPGPDYLTDDDGNVLTTDGDYPLVTNDSPPQPPPTPVYVTPPLPPLPPEIEEGGFSEP